MNLENIFFWMAVLSCAALLVRCVPLLRQGRALGWAIVGAAILTVCGAGMVFFPGHVGAVAGTLWFALIALPSLLIRAVLRHALGQRYLQAERVARLVRWLHPADGWREMPDIYRALAFAQAGQREQGATLLGHIA